MNYIKKLQDSLTEANAEIAGLKKGMNDIRYYLRLAKFDSPNTTVEKQDIFNRLNDMQDMGDHARYAAAMENKELRRSQTGVPV